jgi:hypothetical protein
MKSLIIALTILATGVFAEPPPGAPWDYRCEQYGKL